MHTQYLLRQTLPLFMAWLNGKERHLRPKLHAIIFVHRNLRTIPLHQGILTEEQSEQLCSYDILQYLRVCS